MANGQNTALLMQAGMAYATGGASLAAGGMGGAGGMQGAAMLGALGSGGGFLSDNGTTGPSSSDAMFGSPFTHFDSSGWNVVFGDGSEVSAAVGDRGNTSAPAPSKSTPTSYSSGEGIPAEVWLVGVAVLAILAVKGVK